MPKVLMEIEECAECVHMRYRCCGKYKHGVRSVEVAHRTGEPDNSVYYPVPDWCPIRIDNKHNLLEAIAKDWGSEADEHWEEIDESVMNFQAYSQLLFNT